MLIIKIIGYVGFPTIIAALAAIIKIIKEERVKNKAMYESMKSLMLSQLIQAYNFWTPKGYAPIYARQNFEMLYANYKLLGGDGFADDIHGKFCMLPTEKVKKKQEKEIK